MVIKRINNPRGLSSKTARIGTLVDYIKAGRADEKDKTEFVFTSGDFYADSWTAQRRDMIALATVSTRSPDPVDHWLLSWKEGEIPTQDQCREAVAILKRNLGMRQENLAMCALHKNTDNYHLHIALNRVDPVRLRVVDSIWAIHKAHRAVAKIVHAQGWEPEVNALYRINDEGKAVRNRSEGRKSFRARTLDIENATGEKSRERIASERAAPVLLKAQGWSQVHAELARIGMRYDRKGSGAILWAGDQPVKASSVGRKFSLSSMERRLGAFRPDNEPRPDQLLPLAPEPLHGSMQLWEEYQKQQSARKQRKTDAVAKQRAEHQSEREELAAVCKDERRALLHKDFPGQALNVGRSLLAEDHAQRRTQLKEKHKQERNELQKQFGNPITYEQFLVQEGEEQLAQDWRYRNARAPVSYLSGVGEGTVEAQEVRYFAARVEHMKEGKPAAVAYYYRYAPYRVNFRDRGRRIDVLETADENTVQAALQLAAQKWGTVRVDGPPEFRLLCVRFAARNGIEISNPEHGTPQEAAGPVGNPYEAHRRDILSLMSVKNPAQLDWMIAVRMRVTGHSQESIAKVLAENAPSQRAAEKRDWNHYAGRTARAVYGPRGDREYQHNAARAAVWKSVERSAGRPAHAITRRQREKGMSR